MHQVLVIGCLDVPSVRPVVSPVPLACKSNDKSLFRHRHNYICSRSTSQTRSVYLEILLNCWLWSVARCSSSWLSEANYHCFLWTVCLQHDDVVNDGLLIWLNIIIIDEIHTRIHTCLSSLCSWGWSTELQISTVPSFALVTRSEARHV